MTDEMLKNVLETARARADKDGWASLPEGRLMTLYCGHQGVPLNVGKVEAIRVANGMLHAKNTKGEQFVVALADVFACAFDVGSVAANRKAGFLG